MAKIKFQVVEIVDWSPQGPNDQKIYCGPLFETHFDAEILAMKLRNDHDGHFYVKEIKEKK